jgi:serine-type D-Ala-D-Ala carboxypeptidase/endopeptidase (penicillin-binding protein 4)
VTRLRWWLCAGLLLGAGVAGALTLRGTDSPAPSATAAVATPMWSARRFPGPIVDPLTAAQERDAVAVLQQQLDAEAVRYDSACFVVQRGATVLASRNAATPLLPASTQKLLVATAALTTLGPDFRFETRAVRSGPGASVERLWIVGAGDPVLRTTEFVDAGVSTPLDALADAIVADGIARVGTVIADDSRYDQERYVPTWKPGYREDLDVGPVGALVVDQGVTLATGRPALVDDPARQVGDELARLLRARGVTVGDVSRGTAPADAVEVGSVTSQPLRTIVGYTLAVSDNLAAEMLTKEMGTRLRNEGSTTAGVDAVRDALGRLGVRIDGAPTVDGSGLDRGDRLTCADLVAVLGLAARADLRVLHDVLPGDPRSGGDGTLRAKGGYLDDVTGLAGVVDRASPLTFAFLANGGVPAPARNALAQMRRVADVLGAYQPPPRVADAVVPEPTAPRERQ